MATRRQAMKLMDAQLAAGVRVESVQAWCREHGVSARTYYRHRARIETEGEWRERSRRPHRSPRATGEDLEAWIRKLRADLAPDNGADFILDQLTGIAITGEVGWSVPSRSTVNRVLGRLDLLDRNPAKRPRSSWRRFSYARPRDCYQIDATNIALANGLLVVAFEVLDDCSRLLAACHAAESETADAAVTAITEAFDEHGPSAIVLADNGTCFTTRFRNKNAGPSRFAQTLHNRGTRLIHSSPYHPQTCGKVERHHQTLKKWLSAQPHQPTTLSELQALLDTYREHYNNRRHSALNRRTPLEAWTNADSLGGPETMPRQADATIHRPTVSTEGRIEVGVTRIGVGRRYRGQQFTVIRDGNHATVYNSDGQSLGHVNLATTRSYKPLIPTP